MSELVQHQSLVNKPCHHQYLLTLCRFTDFLLTCRFEVSCNFAPGRVRSIVMSTFVCLLTVCLSARTTRIPHGQASPNFMHVPYGRGLVLL